MTKENTHTRRGCGDRSQNSLYLCVPMSLHGMPLEYFMVDPVIPIDQKLLRSPMMIRDGNDIVHIALGIGKTSYPFVPDFCEEVRRMGVSKRVPNHFDPSALTPFKSKFILIHPRGIPHFKYKLLKKPVCPKAESFKKKALTEEVTINIQKKEHQCIKDLWSLSSLQKVKEKHELSELADSPEELLVTTPSAKYRVMKTARAKQPYKYSTGIILAFPSYHFEYVNKGLKVPQKLKQRILKCGFKLEVHEE